MVALALLVAGGVAAGAFGALLGLGGGVLIVPLLTLGFGLPLREAVGASLVCVIVTSSAAASVYLQRDVANLRLGMTLEMFTALAALAGGLVAFLIPERILALMFSGLLLYVAATMARSRSRSGQAETTATAAAAGAAGLPGGLAGTTRGLADAPGGLAGTTRDAAPAAGPAPPVAVLAGGTPISQPGFVESLAGPGYRIRNVRLGVAGSLLAGIVSALFGVGGGIVKVPVMNLIMGVPLRVATATSNLMIGVTASAGALVYLMKGGIDPYVAAPTAVGVFVGASFASRLAHRVDLGLLRLLFTVVLVLTAAQMIVKAVA